ncbi:MAG: UDP-N-acetylmuramate dehydrogenase [Pseudomonadota bacterium]
MTIPAHWQRRWNLAPHLTLGVHSEAQFGLTARTEDELIEALQQARSLSVPTTVIGGGSNIIPAKTVAGLVIKFANRGIRFEASGQGCEVHAAAGENWHALVRAALGRGLQGIECLALIPGSVGAAPIQNIGAYGQEFAQRCVSVRVYSPAKERIVERAAAECAFGYRSSRFKVRRDLGEIVLSVQLSLPRAEAPSERQPYAEVDRELANMGIVHPQPVHIAEAVCRVRRRKLPDWRRLGNVGSVFKNPTVSTARFATLQAQHPGLIGYPRGDSVRLAAGALIERCGWRGRWQGSAGVWQRQALVLVQRRSISAPPDSTAFVALLQAVQDSVEERFDLRLEVEPVQLR